MNVLLLSLLLMLLLLLEYASIEKTAIIAILFNTLRRVNALLLPLLLTIK